jgi:ketosteroid isomerase-like protein
MLPRATFRALVTILLVVVPVAAAPAFAGKAEKARQAILKADKEFNRAVKDKDLEAFRDRVTEDALFFGSALNHGREAVARAWAPFFEPGAKSSLTWEPVRAEVAASGDLGYTVGDYVLRTLGEDGAVAEKTGAYVTVWRKGGDGKWRAALDIGTVPGSAPIEVPSD